MNYFVPNFGLDHDILASKANAEEAEKSRNHKWVIPEKKPKGPPVNYFVPNFGQDEEIKASLSNLSATEAKYGKWNLPPPADE